MDVFIPEKSFLTIKYSDFRIQGNLEIKADIQNTKNGYVWVCDWLLRCKYSTRKKEKKKKLTRKPKRSSENKGGLEGPLTYSAER